MAARSEVEVLRTALNRAARNANIADENDTDDVGQLITDYFLIPGADEDCDTTEGDCHR